MKDLMVVSDAKWCPFSSVGAEAACEACCNYSMECVAVSSGQDYTQDFSAALSQWTSSVSAYSHFGNYITAFNPLLWPC